jgi:tetratricopeptide (TPR) repeat protein
MTVRWKPLLILSGLFLLVAVVGVIAMAWTLVPRSSQGILKQARTAAATGRFEDAEIYYKQALQIDSKSAAIHEEIADLYASWLKKAPDEKREDLAARRTDHLFKATRFDKSSKGPRLALLEGAMLQAQGPEASSWARDVLRLDPANADAHYVLAAEELEAASPNVPEVKQHLEAMEEAKAPAIRVALLRAMLARATGDDRARDAAFAQVRALPAAPDAGLIDRMARVRLEAIEVQSQGDPARLDAQVKGIIAHARELIAVPDLAPGQVSRLSLMLEQIQRSLVPRSGKAKAGGDPAIDALVESLEAELETLFQKTLDASHGSDLQVYLSYCDHLRFRQQRERCLKLIEEALGQPSAGRPNNLTAAMGLHAVAVEMSLARQDDGDRFQKAAPHIQALLASTEPRFQGLGHLFQGAVDLELSGLARPVAQAGEKQAKAPEAQPKLRASALQHLKLAANQLPNLAEAQARYGVALVLSQEQNLGRQYLQNALRMGNLEPQYQFWAAWTILQAGYPEEAAPIVDALFQQLAAGTIPAELKGTLHQISGEIFQARRAPGDLERAAHEFETAARLGQRNDAAIELRQAQIDVQLGHHDQALARLDRLRDQGVGGPGAENLAILIHEEQGKKEEARALLKRARQRFPQSPELAGLDAALRNKDGKPAEADQLLKDFLARNPDNVPLTIMRAQVLDDALKRPKEACEILRAVAERCDNSSPLVQLAQIEMEQDDLEAAAATIGKIQARWKEASTGDILEGQLALKRGSVPEAREHFAVALKKDPENKIIQFWKAQLDSRTGSVKEAAQALEDLVKNRPSKEVDTGVTLMTAAQSALANLSLQTGKVDEAIRRFEELKRSSASGTLNRGDRWQLITAYVAKGQWDVAKRELAAILNDPKNPPNDDERVRGANLYREHNEEGAALAQLDYVLKVNPTNPMGVVTRSSMYLNAKKYDEAARVLRRAIELSNGKSEKPPGVFYLMLAAVENEMPPGETAARRAQQALDDGLAAQPRSLELVQAKYLLLSVIGDRKGAIAFVESKARDDSTGTFRRFLVDVLRDQKEYARAQQLLRELMSAAPEDANLPAGLVQVMALEAAEAAALGDASRQHALDEKLALTIAEYRKRFPQHLIFLQAECDLAARRGDFSQAVAITEEIDKVAQGTRDAAAGPLLRARLYARQGKSLEVVRAYREALERNPRQPEVRLYLAQELLNQDEPGEALKQVRNVLESEPERLEAILLEARALVRTGSTSAEKQAAAQTAVERLEKAIAREPKFLDAYHALADIEMSRGGRAAALDAMRRDLKANPNDSAAVARLIQMLASRDPAGGAGSQADLQEARKFATEIAGRDKTGALILAAGVGFHKSGHLDLALPLSQKAAEMLNNPVAHLNLGDLLLSMAEAQPDARQARPLFERAIGEYDRVLKVQPAQVEAVNNKAWVLHSYLGRSQEAMELMKGLMDRAEQEALPGEFYDTLGSIQEALGRPADAEQSYLSGLSKAPEHPVLNYHFGKLISADRSRSNRAKGHLAKALAARDQLSPTMVKDAEHLVQQLGRPFAGN